MASSLQNRIRKEANLWLIVGGLFLLAAPIASFTQIIFSTPLHPVFSGYSAAYREIANTFEETFIGWMHWNPSQWMTDLYLVRVALTTCFVEYATHPNGHIRWQKLRSLDRLVLIIVPFWTTLVILNEIRRAGNAAILDIETGSYISALIGFWMLQVYVAVASIGLFFMLNMFAFLVL